MLKCPECGSERVHIDHERTGTDELGFPTVIERFACAGCMHQEGADKPGRAYQAMVDRWWKGRSRRA